MKDRIFFPLTALIAGGIIYLAINPPFSAKPIPVKGVEYNGTINFTKSELDNFKPNGEIIVRPTTRLAGIGNGIHIAAQNVIKPDGMNGAKLEFDAATIAKIGKSPVRIAIQIGQLKHSESINFALSIYGGGQAIWQNHQTPQGQGKVIFTFNHNLPQIEGIMINPSLEGQNRGVEIEAISIYKIESQN